MRFSEVIGHKELKSRLVRGIDDGRISHAQLFTGKSGYGTLALSLAYAQYVNCVSPVNGDSCGECLSCLKISQLAHPDMHFVFPVNSKGGFQKMLSDSFLPKWRDQIKTTGGYFNEQMWYDSINIENQQGLISRAEADEIIRKLSFKSFEAKYKIMIIWLPERMRTEAANSLLKILEEPWERTLFLMVSEQPSRLLPTILSRVQEISVPGIDTGDLSLEFGAENTGKMGELDKILRLSKGDILEAKRLLDDNGGDGAGEYFELFTQLMRFSYNDRHMELLDWGDNAAALGRERQKQFLRYSLKMLRENFMFNTGMHDITYLWGEELDFSKKFSPYIGFHNIEKLVSEIESALAQVGQNGNPRIIFPHFALAVSKLITRL